MVSIFFVSCKQLPNNFKHFLYVKGTDGGTNRLTYIINPRSSDIQKHDIAAGISGPTSAITWNSKNSKELHAYSCEP